MTVHRLDQLVAFCLILFGVYLVWSGNDFGFMNGFTPGPGYFPAIAGALLVVLSAVNLARSLAGLEELKSAMARGELVKFVVITAAMLGFVVITPYVGLTVATMILMFAIGLVIRPTLERAFLVRLGLTSIMGSLACHVVFGTLLRVPLPPSAFGF
jgi:hypothetical protein